MSVTDETLDSPASGHTERVAVTETLVRGQIVDGRYEIGELLGQGAMGSVVSARHVVLRTRLAIKVMRPELTLDAEAMARFRQEAQVVGAIGHPNIVDVRDFGTLPSADGVSPGASYFVMEHLEGRELGTALFEDGPFSVERAVHVVQQMAEALDAAHARGVVHRDVKPANTLLVREGSDPDHVKMLDFGIAKLDSSRLTRRARVLGTPAYMAPEQAQGAVVDARADVYALTIVLFELLTGRLPLDDPHPFKLLRKQVTDAPPSILEFRPELPEELARLIAHGLEKRAADRIPSMRALIESLEPFGRSRRATPAPAVGPASVSPASVCPASVSPASASPASTSSIDARELAALETTSATPVAVRAVHAPDASARRTRTTIALAMLALFAVLGVALLAAGARSLRHGAERRNTAVAPTPRAPRAVQAASSLQLTPPSVRDAAGPRDAHQVTPAVARAPAPTITTPTTASTAPPTAAASPPTAAAPSGVTAAAPTQRTRRRARPLERVSVAPTAPASESPVDRSAIDPWY